MAEIYANNVRGKLAEPVLAADTRLTLQPGHNFIDPGSHWYRATLFRWEFTSEGIREFDHEVVKVTGLAGDMLTVERELEGTARAYDPDTPIELRMTAGTASDIEHRARQSLDDHSKASDPHPSYVVKEGAFGWDGQRFSSLFVHDGRTIDPEGSASDYLPTPDALPGRALTALFSQGLPGDSWRSALAVSGWNNGYVSWLLVGPSGTAVDNNFYLVAGRGGGWGPSLKLWHDENFNPDDYAKPTSDQAWTSAQTYKTSILLESENGAKQRFNARDDGTQARVHFYGSPNTGGTGPFLQAWFGGDAYVNVTTTNDGVEFDGTLTATGFDLPAGVTLRGVTNGLEITRSAGSVEIGNRNSGYTHYTSSAGKHYFYGKVYSQSGFYGDGSSVTNVNAVQLNGQSRSVNDDANTVAGRDSAGDIRARLFRSTYTITNSNIAVIYTAKKADGTDFMRPSTPAQVRDSLDLGAAASAGLTSSRTSSSTSHALTAKAMNAHRTSGDHDGRYAPASGFDAVGSYALAQYMVNDRKLRGETVPGSDLCPVFTAQNNGAFVSSSIRVSGTWMCMGRAEGTQLSNVTLWQRIS
ncbi:hypothetical protein ACQKFL_11220 [Vreelandella titanicae]|uniref:hypothetical protein n=1 Tax=Vreelandella titanicae TaxID=664683 RepID=UPI003D033619|tara:strand:- start:1984 stop:3732 length:1749 start_codon:yes stop_codon:yes gene_type:complete